MTRCDSCEYEVHINYSAFICILDQAVRNYLLSVTSHLMKTFKFPEGIYGEAIW